VSTVKDYVATIEGICGAEKDVIVTFRCEEKDIAITNIIKRSVIQKSVSGLMFELEFQDVTFRLFSSGRAVFRSIKNRKELNRILAALLL
jgi:TATA-box binding protein (TBP) (component of TFIID and TFIIIB)